MRSKKTGSDLELSVMASFSKVLKQMPEESRVRVVNWVASQTWENEPEKVEHTADPRQVTLPALS